MFEIEKLPQHILCEIADRGVRPEDVYLTSYCDMNRDHTHCDTYLIATADTLYILSGTVGLTPKGNQATCVVEVVEEIPMSPLATLIYHKTQGGFTGWTFALQDVDQDGTAELLARTHGEDGLPVIWVMNAATGEELYSFKTGVDEEWALWKRKDGSRFILVSYTQNLKNGDVVYAMDELTSAGGKAVCSPVLFRKVSGGNSQYNARIDGVLMSCDKATYNTVRTTYFAENTQTEELAPRWVGGPDAETIATALQSE